MHFGTYCKNIRLCNFFILFVHCRERMQIHFGIDQNRAYAKQMHTLRLSDDIIVVLNCAMSGVLSTPPISQVRR